MPKLYFAKRNLKVPQGGKVHVRYSYGAVFGHGGNVDNKLNGAIDEARKALDCTVNYLRDTDTANLNDNFTKWSKKYFFTGNTLSEDEANAIYAVLHLTKMGVDNVVVK